MCMNFPGWLVCTLSAVVPVCSEYLGSFYSSRSGVFFECFPLSLFVITALALGRFATRSFNAGGLKRTWILPFPKEPMSSLSLANDHSPPTTTPDTHGALIWSLALLWAFVCGNLTPWLPLRSVDDGSCLPTKDGLKTQGSFIPNGKPMAIPCCSHVSVCK